MVDVNIGFIKYFNPIQKFGFIRTYYHEVFFHYSNSNKTSFNIGDVVGFVLKESEKYENRPEAIEVKLAEDYTTQFKLSQGKFNNYEWGMILKGSPILLGESIKSSLNGKFELLDSIDKHIDSTDINDLIKSYKVKITTGYRYKPGDDDCAWVAIQSYWTPESCNWNIYRNDNYIKMLFPEITKNVFYSRDFKPWQDIISEYKEDKENWNKLEAEALQMQHDILDNARISYNIVDHTRVLRKYLEAEIALVKNRYEILVSDLLKSWKYNEIIEKGNL